MTIEAANASPAGIALPNGKGPLTPAKPTRNAQIERAARMLEGVFLRQLFSVMRKTVPKAEGVFKGGFGADVYREMLDGALADGMAKVGGIGLADDLVRQWGGKVSAVAIDRAGLTASASAVGALPRLDRAGSADTTATAQGQRALDAVRRQRANQLDGLTFEPPNRPEPVTLSDQDGQLVWPLPGGRMVDSQAGLLQAPENTEVIAAASGRVLQASGDMLVLEHEGGMRTLYKGLAHVEAQVGDLVLRGQQLGRLGTSEKLSFAVRKQGQNVQLSEIADKFLKALQR